MIDSRLQVKAAMDESIHLLLCHEMPGLGQEVRHACTFETVMDSTPRRLLDGGVYSEIATPIKGQRLRDVSTRLVLKKIAEGMAISQQDSEHSHRCSGFFSLRFRMLASFSQRTVVDSRGSGSLVAVEMSASEASTASTSVAVNVSDRAMEQEHQLQLSAESAKGITAAHCPAR